LNHIKVETLVHPIFSRLILALHEKDENDFRLSKAELKEMLNTNDAMLTEVLIKLTPYLQEPIENMLDIPDDQKMEFTVVWERVYEDFLGDKYPQLVQ
jgi:plasmid replication initiation protein